MSGMAVPQHRGSLASIDSAFDQEMMNPTMNRWTSADHSANRAVSNSDDSSRKLDQQGKDDDDENRPAWSELKTKAGKERKRLPLACIACRRKKIRCSGEKPACKHCLRARVPCVYKVTTRKAAPRTDYMAMLDKRLKRMEDRVIKVIPKEELPDLSTTGRASVRPPLPGQTPKKDKTVPGRKRSADEAFTQELSDWTSSRERVSLLDPSTGLRKQREGENKLFIEGSESLPPQHIQEHLAEVFFDCVYGQSYLLLHKPSFMRKLKAGTVPPVLILAVCAISARFSTHPQVSTEPAFLRGEQWATPARRIIEKRHYEPNITILIAMIMLGLHYFGTCEGGLSWSFGGQAMRMGYALQLHRELDHDPLGRNQIAAKSTDPSRPPADSTKSPELSFTDREIRRRTMWACYLMDTFNSSGTERPSFLNEDYFQIQLPITESHFQMEVAGPTEDLHGNIPMSQHAKSKTTLLTASDTTHLQTEARSNMGVAAYIVRSVVLWKRIVKYLNLGGKDLDPHPIWDPLSTFSTLARNITHLKSSLPPTLTYTPANLATHTSSRLANQFLFLHIILAQTSLFLHRFAIPTTPTRHPHSVFLGQGMPKAFLTQSAQMVLQSAQSISELIATSSGLTLTVPFAGYCAYASATVHVWGVFSRVQSQQRPALEKGQGVVSEGGGLEERSKELLRVNYRYLTRMKRYWGMFHYMAESVKDVYRVFADASLRYSEDGQKASLVRRRSGVGGGGEEGKGQGGMLGSAEGSRAATPGSHRQNTSVGSTKQMFQYGDWFDKYPHGVSEAEWESSHLEFRREGDKGSEAVMSQRSELQSVEEFFATLSPPSKGEEGKGRKRRRGKSLAEGVKKEGGAQQGQRASVSGGARPDVQRQQSVGGPVRPAADLAMAPTFPTEFDMTTTSPTLYQNPQSAASTNPLGSGFSPTASSNFNYNYATPIPNLDRQFVMGAYAGVDPSTTSAVGMGSGNAFGQGNAWDALDTFAGYGTGEGFGMDNGMGSGSSAWFMPFNMEPPNFAGMGDELGGGALDGMDFNDLGGHDQASFSEQGGPGGQT